MTDRQEPETPTAETIILTAAGLAAAERLEAGEPGYRGKPLRLYLEGKGCDGFYYGVSFDEVRDGDLHFQQGRIHIVCDQDAFDFVKGSVVDWIDDERGQGFLVDNPAHRRFRGKFYKKQSWQDRLTAKRDGAATSSSQ